MKPFVNHDISSHACLKRADELMIKYKLSSNAHFIIYAALELRICIERILFEYLILIQIDSNGFTQAEKIYRTKDFKQAIDKHEPEFSLKIQFINVYLKMVHLYFAKQGVMVDKLPTFIVDLDFKILSQIHGKLSALLHSLKNPEQTTQSVVWNETQMRVINQSFEYLSHVILNGQVHLKLNNKGIIHYEVFKSNTITNEQLIETMISDFKPYPESNISVAENGDLIGYLISKYSH